MKVLLMMLVIAAIPALSPAASQITESAIYNFEITRIIDGDTVAFRADFLPAPLKPELSLRVWGVDTPEKSWRAQCDQEKQLGEAASRFTTEQIENATTVEISILKWDKYGGRVLGDVIIDGNSLTEMLLEQGYARVYRGDKKQSWCE